MVAYTSPDCLPYLECDDLTCVNTGTLCEPSTVWCDFAEGVDAKLTQFDDIVARTATTVPMAIVQRTTPFTHLVSSTQGEFVQFTESVADTDNMVNIDSYPLGFTVNTPGLYQWYAYLYGLTATNGSDLGITISMNFTPAHVRYGPASQSFLSETYQANIDDILVTPMLHMVLPVLAGQTASLFLNTGGDTADSVTFTYAMMGVSWVSDLP